MLKDYSLRQYALAYAKVGMAVFPLVPKSKNPATQHGFQDATTDFNQIDKWWMKNPNYNIGISTAGYRPSCIWQLPLLCFPVP